MRQCSRLRDRALVALMTYGGLRRSEIASLNVEDYVPDFGLRRVLGKGGHEAVVPLPEVARAMVSDYLAKERPQVKPGSPLFIVEYLSKGGGVTERRMRDHRVWKIVKDWAKRSGTPGSIPMRFGTAAASSCSSARAAIFVLCRSICGMPTSRRRRSTRG
jgi:site-specific recombinase XerD